MSQAQSYWDVVYDGVEYGIIQADSPTNHHIIARTLPLMEASKLCNQYNKDLRALQPRNTTVSLENMLDGALDKTGEVAGKRVKALLNGFRRGRQ